MDNWRTRVPNNYNQPQYYGVDDDYYSSEYENYQNYGGGRRFERNRNFRPSNRQEYYKSRGDTYQQGESMFGNSMYLPPESPHNDPLFPNRAGEYANGGFVNQGFDYEGEGNAYEDFIEPDYEDSEDDVIVDPQPPSQQQHQQQKPPQTHQEQEKKDGAPPSKSRVQRRERWDVFGESASDVSTSQSEKHGWKTINMVMRLVVAIIFFCFVFATATVSRLSLLMMTYNVRPGTSNFTVAYDTHRTYLLKEMNGRVDLKWVWCLIVVVASPYVFSAIASFWSLIFKKTQPLRFGPLLAALSVETLHSLGLCTLVFYVLPSFDPVVGCLLLLNVAFFPGLIQMFQTEQRTSADTLPSSEANTASPGDKENAAKAESSLNPSKCMNASVRQKVRKVLDALMILLHLGGMLVWSCRAYVVMDDVMLAVLTPVAMLLTSLSWWDNYVSGKKERGSGKSGSTNKSSAEKDSTGNARANGDVKTSPSADSNPKTTDTVHGRKKANFLTTVKRAIKKCRTKITLLTALWKIAITILYPAVAFGYGSDDCFRAFFYFHESQARGPHSPLATECSLFTSLDFVDEMRCNDNYPFLIAAVNVGCSIICYKIAKSACKVLLQIPCFVVPLALVTPCTLVVLVAFYMDHEDLNYVLGCQVHWIGLDPNAQIGEFLRDFTLVYWLPVGLVAYISLLYFAGHIWSPKAERMSRTDKLFSKPMYCGVLLDQSLMLNRRRDEDDPAEHRLAGQWMAQVQDVGGMDLDEARSALRKDTTPLIYICATMWHESETEMVMMLKSVFRLDADQSARKNAQLYFNITDPDYYEFEAHIFFDDAFQGHGDEDFEYTVNNFVKQLVRVVDESASAVHNTELHVPKPKKIPTPYGGRLVWRLPGGNTLTAHLKDKAKIRHRKRWSQVMYMYYFLGHKLISTEQMSLTKKKLRAENTFLLALDGDVDFQPEAVQILVDRMKQTPELGAACGRIHPIGSGPMVWYQKFEYAVSHWLQKATEHILGCVLCSPGCFSLFRGSALMDDNVMKRYTTPPTEARHYVQYDQGEDRWLCTLLLQQGYRVEYCAASDSYTFAPEGFYEFYNQRRRWTPSTMANIIDLLGDWRNTTKNNQDISVLYIIYQLFLLASGIITPGTIFLLIVGAISSATQDSIPLWTGLLINAIPIFIFVLLCFKASTATQLAYAGILSVFYTIVMMLVLVGIIRGAAVNGFCSVSTTFLMCVVGVFVVTALLHPMECTAILHGFLYFLSIPSMSMLLLIYSLANLHNVSWGTREVKSAAPPPPQQGPPVAEKKATSSNFIREALGKLADTHNADSDYAFSFGNLFRCLCCPREGTGPNDVKFHTIMKSIEVLDTKVTEMTMTSGVGDSLHGISDLPDDNQSMALPLSSPRKFSEAPELFEGAVEKVNPVYKKPARDELRNPKWAEDVDVGDGDMEFVDNTEKEFWVKFIGQYLYPLDKDEKHEQAIKEELMGLRNNVSMAFLLINTLFVVLVSSLQIISENTTNLSVEIPCERKSTFTGEKIEPISVTFTLVFGIMLTLQFLAMLFHRYSTMLHIISITEIKVKRLTRLTRQKTEEEQPTVEETINLVREMQAIGPQAMPEPEADYGDLDTPQESLRSPSSKIWGKIGQRARRIQREQTLSRAFMKNFEKLAKQIRTESTSENSPVQLEADMKHNFRNLEGKSLSTIVKMAKDAQYKDHILKRSREARRNWRRGFARLKGARAQFSNLVQEAKEKKEEEEEEEVERRRQEEMAQAQAAAEGAGPWGSFVDPEAAGMAPHSLGQGLFRVPSRRGSGHGGGDSSTAEVFRF